MYKSSVGYTVQAMGFKQASSKPTFHKEEEIVVRRVYVIPKQSQNDSWFCAGENIYGRFLFPFHRTIRWPDDHDSWIHLKKKMNSDAV